MFFESFAYFLSKINCFSAFINTAEGFPKPLTKEEERLEFEKYKNNTTMDFFALKQSLRDYLLRN